MPELPSSGTVLTVVTLTIQNLGYDKFESNKNYFSAVVRGETYPYDSSCYANDLLPDTGVFKGETLTGNLTFTVPDPASPSDIIIQYSSPAKYDINWIRY